MRSLRLRAYAKINLGLKVLGRRPDGYHGIDTLLQSIDLADELFLQPRAAAEITLTMEPDLGLPLRENLVMQAARLILRRAGVRRGVSIHLRKEIPVGAGLGGGSSDAAAVLAGLNELLGLGFSLEELQTMGVELGSDVPFFLLGGRCRARGRGELLEKLPEDPSLGVIVLLVPPFAKSTREVYEAFDRLVPRTLPSFYPNDLEAAALEIHPVLWAYRAYLERAGVPFGLSGSGPTYFALLQGNVEEGRLAGQVRAELGCRVFLCRPTLWGHQIV